MMLSDNEVVMTSTVIQDCIDRLQIIGRLLPVPMSSDTGGSSGGGDAKNEPEKAHLPKGVSSRHGLFPVGLSNPISFEAKLPIPEDIFKLQLDREFLEYTLKKTVVELQINSTYNILLEALKGEYVRRHAAAVVRESEEEKRLQVEVLKCNLANIRLEKEKDLKYYTDMIAWLTDQLREVRVRVGLEEKYVTKQTSSYLEQGHKRFESSQAAVAEKVEKLKDRLDEEAKTHIEIESYLRANLDRLDHKTNYWMEKYEVATESKDHEIQKLQQNKERTRVRKNEISPLLDKFYQVIEEDRLEKELMRQMQLEEEMQEKAALKIQAWWRGVLVRELLGPFRKLRPWFKQRRLEVKKLAPGSPKKK